MHRVKVTAPSSDVLASVAGSTCTQDYPWLPELVRRATEAYAGRSIAIADRNRERAKAQAESAEALIIENLGARSLDYPGHVLARVVHNALKVKGHRIGYRRVLRVIAARKKCRQARTGEDTVARYRGSTTFNGEGSK